MQRIEYHARQDWGIIFRAYNEGIAYRFYTLKRGSSSSMTRLRISLLLATDSRIWHIPRAKDRFAMAFQNIYTAKPLVAAAQAVGFPACDRRLRCGESHHHGVRP